MMSVAVTLAAGAAHAADYAPPPCYDAGAIATGHAPPGAVPCYAPPVVIEEFSGWYLRGDIGMSNQSVKSLDNPAFSNFDVVGYGFDSAPIFGVGVGYYFNDWMRFDVTGEYRGRSNFHGLENYGTFTDEYHGSKSELTFLANAYVDLGTWRNFTPFVGAGIGVSRNSIYNFTDNNIPTNGVAFAGDNSKWSLAWALHAGVAYKVTKNFAVEFSYRYLDLGDAVTGDIVTYDGSCPCTNNPTTFHHLSSHDFRLGLRFNLDAFESYSRPAQYYAPPPVYQPPPVYTQPPPPIRSRG
ncbi:MAG TPA: outer membrane protein [Pseudolabrys sp.]|nr:outer membrane protein [Pseudolabrys sp.]